MNYLRFLINLAVLLCLAGTVSAQTQPKESRVALVIGNGTYKTSPLKNPVNDAKDMATKLRGLGFVVIERSNLGIRQIGSTLREFRSKLAPGGVALVFYAGHGLQIKGENYLPAVDADIASEEDVPTQSIAMKQIMDVLADANTRLNLVFLDACRNNPYARSFRSAGDGLSRVAAPSGTLISYATRPGSVAADGDGRNGLYTGALLQQMSNTGQQIEQALKRVVTNVKAGSKNLQEPWMEGSIEGDFCFGECELSTQAPGATSSPPPAIRVRSTDEIEQELWDSIRINASKESIQEFIRQYPSGRFVGQARVMLAGLQVNKLAPAQPVQLNSGGQLGVEVHNAWARFTVPGQTTTGAFMKISANEDAKLIAASSPLVGMAEIHEMKMDGSVMKMRAVAGGLDIPAGMTVELKPGGYHVMLMDLRQTLTKDSNLPLTLVFKDSRGIERKVLLQVRVTDTAPR